MGDSTGKRCGVLRLLSLPQTRLKFCVFFGRRISEGPLVPSLEARSFVDGTGRIFGSGRCGGGPVEVSNGAVFYCGRLAAHGCLDWALTPLRGRWWLALVALARSADCWGYEKVIGTGVA